MPNSGGVDVSLVMLVQLARRFWYLTLCGALVAGILAGLMLVPRPLYYTRFEVLFVDNSVTPDEAYIWGSSEDLVPYVRIVELLINQGQSIPTLNSSWAPLYGTGVREGVKVQVENLGNQWKESIKNPALIVEAVGPSPEHVAALADQTVLRIDRTNREFQSEQGVPKEAWAKPVPVMGTPEIGYVGSTRSGGLRAVIATGLASTIATSALLVAAGSMWDRRRTSLLPQPVSTRIPSMAE